jgi:YfiH family protein
VVAAVHAGWRGTASRISAEVLQKMTEQFGTAPSDVWAAIGPGIGPCCYAVGDDVARQLGLDRAGRADLAQVNRDHLISAGVAEDRIETLRICTYCDPARFHSYRRDKLEAGRMISYVCMV